MPSEQLYFWSFVMPPIILAVLLAWIIFGIGDDDPPAAT